MIYGEFTLYGWNGMEHNEGAHFRLIFQKESKVKLDMLGYNFVVAHGTYRFAEDSLIAISFDQIDAPPSDKHGYTSDWPLLRLTESEGYLQIHREDGKTAWHIDWPLYPEIKENLWPVTAAIKSVEQGGSGQPATRSESDLEDGDKPQPESEWRSR